MLNPNRRVSDQVKFRDDLIKVIQRLQTMLIEKNTKYGDAALNPKRTFSKASAIDLIDVRMDDKLSRIENRKDNEDEDPEWDLLGYLVLKQIALMRIQEEKDEKAREVLLTRTGTFIVPPSSMPVGAMPGMSAPPYTNPKD